MFHVEQNSVIINSLSFLKPRNEIPLIIRETNKLHEQTYFPVNVTLGNIEGIPRFTYCPVDVTFS